jgi:predicted phosphoribosyltransferase
MAPENIILQDRLQVAHLLAEKLWAYKNTDAVVVAVPRGGVPIGLALADLLNISMEIVACKKIKHPAYGNKSIGSVSIDALVVKEELRNIPQDYIYHQVVLLQHTLRSKCEYYRGNNPVIPLSGKTVIVVDDMIQTGDTILACLKSIKRQNPERVIMTASISTPEGAQIVSNEVDEFISLQIEKGNQLHGIFEPVTDEEVRVLLNAKKFSMVL